MFQSRMLNNHISNIYESAFRFAHRDCITSFEKLLKKDKFVTINQKELHVLATENFKT